MDDLDPRDPELYRRDPQDVWARLRHGPVTEPDIEPKVFARAVRTFDLGFGLR